MEGTVNIKFDHKGFSFDMKKEFVYPYKGLEKKGNRFYIYLPYMHGMSGVELTLTRDQAERLKEDLIKLLGVAKRGDKMKAYLDDEFTAYGASSIKGCFELSLDLRIPKDQEEQFSEVVSKLQDSLVGKKPINIHVEGDSNDS